MKTLSDKVKDYKLNVGLKNAQLRELFIGALAVSIASFLPGQFIWYLSSLPSTITFDNSCFKISKSIAFLLKKWYNYHNIFV